MKLLTTIHCKICGQIGEMRLNNKTRCRKCQLKAKRKDWHLEMSNPLSRKAKAEKSRAYRQVNPARCREICYAWRAANVGKTLQSRRISQKKYRQQNPKKMWCHHAVHRAVKSGRIKRQDCWCGKEAQAHHEDYNKPYEIIWLCPMHHSELHRKELARG